MAAPAERAHEPQLVGRIDACENRNTGQSAIELCIAHQIKFIPRDDLAAPQKSRLCRNGLGGFFVIARDHHRPDGSGRTGADGVLCLRTGRIEHARQSQKDHAAFTAGQSLRLRLFRKSQHTQAPCRECFRFLQDRAAMHLCEGGIAVLCADMAASAENHIGGTLAAGKPYRPLPDDDRHPAGIAVERLFLRSCIAIECLLGDAALGSSGKKCGFRRISDGLPAGITAVRQRRQRCIVAEHRTPQKGFEGRQTLRLDGTAARQDCTVPPQCRARHREILLGCAEIGHGHAVFRDGAGLIRADHRGAAEGFHAVQTIHKSLLLHHPAHGQCKGNGHSCRKSLRNRCNCNRNARHEHVEHRLTPQHARCKYRRTYTQTQQRQHLAKLAKTLLQGRIRPLNG